MLDFLRRSQRKWNSRAVVTNLVVRARSLPALAYSGMPFSIACLLCPVFVSAVLQPRAKYDRDDQVLPRGVEVAVVVELTRMRMLFSQVEILQPIGRVKSGRGTAR